MGDYTSRWKEKIAKSLGTVWSVVPYSLSSFSMDVNFRFNRPTIAHLPAGRFAWFRVRIHQGPTLMSAPGGVLALPKLALIGLSPLGVDSGTATLIWQSPGPASPAYVTLAGLPPI